MNTTMLRRARRHFCNAMAPRHVARHNMRAWVRSIRLLGEKWLFYKPVRRV